MYRMDKALLRVGLVPISTEEIKENIGKIKTTLLSHQCLYARFIVGYKQVTLLLEPEFEDKLRSKDCLEALTAIGFKVREAPTQKAKRSIFVRGVESEETSKSIHQIRDELQDRNDIIVEDVAVLGKYKSVLKIVCKNEDEAIKLTNDGVKFGGQNLLDVHPDDFVDLQFCRKCYSWEHKDRDCDKSPVCSECSSPEHRFVDCKADRKRCVNCDKDHSTLSMLCEVKKAKLEQLKKIKQNEISACMQKSNINSYQGAPPPSVWGKPVWRSDVGEVGGVSQNSQFNIHVDRVERHAVSYAAAMAMHNEDNYKDSYTKFMKLNGITPLKVPDISP